LRLNDPSFLFLSRSQCFWHIQHEFIEGEKMILGRNPHQYTAAAGYAGGKSTDNEGRVCYHNFQGIADYGKLGHGEVVGMTIPQSKIGEFAELYFSLFNPKTKDRVDPLDRGGEYRSLIGLPGGTKHTSYPVVQAAAEKAGFKLEVGKGNDGDTLGKQLVYVYDSNKFPFYQAEVYHQYHNDFQSPPYGKAYNELVNLALEEGRIKGTGCPDRV
jgi:peptide methionine sulfoxide reductase MsrA